MPGGALVLETSLGFAKRLCQSSPLGRGAFLDGALDLDVAGVKRGFTALGKERGVSPRAAAEGVLSVARAAMRRAVASADAEGDGLDLVVANAGVLSEPGMPYVIRLVC